MKSNLSTFHLFLDFSLMELHHHLIFHPCRIRKIIISTASLPKYIALWFFNILFNFSICDFVIRGWHWQCHKECERSYSQKKNRIRNFRKATQKTPWQEIITRFLRTPFASIAKDTKFYHSQPWWHITISLNLTNDKLSLNR